MRKIALFVAVAVVMEFTAGALFAAGTVNPFIYYYQTKTNANGQFVVAHKLTNKDILGILVAVQHKNGSWHTLEQSNKFNNNFWWNIDSVRGWIHSDPFKNRPVRIVVFAVQIPA